MYGLAVAFLAPIYGSFSRWRIGSPFGRRVHPITGAVHMHNGVDIGAPIGTPVRASAAGHVLRAGRSSRGGNELVIGFPELGYTFGFAHLDRLLVKAGQRVRAGQLVARTGNTGLSTAPHLHFTVRRYGSGRTIDPQPIMRRLDDGAGIPTAAAAGLTLAIVGLAWVLSR